MADEITTGELKRVIERVESNINSRLTDLGNRVSSLGYVPNDVYKVQTTEIFKRIDGIEARESKRFQNLLVGFIYPTIVGIVVFLALRGTR